MNLTVTSMFRDSKSQIETYKNQILAQTGFDKIQCCWVEGDSVDNTFGLLHSISNELNAKLVQQNTGRRRWGSVDTPERMAHLGEIGNFLRDATLQMEPTDFIVYVESDLLIRDTELFSKLAAHNVDIVSPIIYHGNTEAFYDTWGYLDQFGDRWSAHPPYSRYLAQDGLCPMMSVGSCVMMKWNVLEVTKWGPNAFRSWCSNALMNNKKIWVDKNLSIYHPKL